MLSRRARSAAFSVSSVALIVAATAGLASAQPVRTGQLPTAAAASSSTSTACTVSEITGQCTISVGGNPTPSSSSSSPGGGAPVCTESMTHTVVACSDPKYGSLDGGCYVKLLSPQPPLSDPIWRGATTGAIYEATCFVIVGGILQLQPMGWTWLQTPPGGVVTPGDVAEMAIKKLKMNGPNIGVAPPPTSYAVVGVPLWLWTTDDEQHTYWGPQTQTATVGAISVTATAQATQITWDMGDGNVQICKNPGTQYTPGATTPACSYTYATTSATAPDQKFTVFGTTTWVVNWSGATSGTRIFKFKSTQPVQLRVESAQAVNQP